MLVPEGTCLVTTNGIKKVEDMIGEARVSSFPYSDILMWQFATTCMYDKYVEENVSINDIQVNEADTPQYMALQYSPNVIVPIATTSKIFVDFIPGLNEFHNEHTAMFLSTILDFRSYKNIVPMLITKKYIHPKCCVYTEEHDRYTDAINGLSYLLDKFIEAFSGKQITLDLNSNPFFPLLIHTKEHAYITARLQHTLLTLPEWELFIQKNTDYSYTFLYKYPCTHTYTKRILQVVATLGGFNCYFDAHALYISYLAYNSQLISGKSYMSIDVFNRFRARMQHYSYEEDNKIKKSYLEMLYKCHGLHGVKYHFQYFYNYYNYYKTKDGFAVGNMLKYLDNNFAIDYFFPCIHCKVSSEYMLPIKWYNVHSATPCLTYAMYPSGITLLHSTIGD